MTRRDPAAKLTIMVGESDQAHHHRVYTEIVHRELEIEGPVIVEPGESIGYAGRSASSTGDDHP